MEKKFSILEIGRFQVFFSRFEHHFTQPKPELLSETETTYFFLQPCKINSQKAIHPYTSMQHTVTVFCHAEAAFHPIFYSVNRLLK